MQPLASTYRFLLLAFALSACRGSPSASEPSSNATNGEDILAIEVSWRNMLQGSEHGIAIATEKALYRLRPGGETTLEVDVRACPWEELDLALPSEDMLLLHDRVIIGRSTCGIWAYLDGDPTPRRIARHVPRKKEEGDEPWASPFSVAWNGGRGPQYDLGMTVAANADALFVCTSTLADMGRDSKQSLWKTALDGGEPRTKLADLTGLCEPFVADDDAVYLIDFARAENQPTLERIDASTGEVRVLAMRDAYLFERLVATKTHLYWIEVMTATPTFFRRALRRVPKGGGEVETVAGDFERVHRMTSDGVAVFVAIEDAILRIDGLVSSTVVRAKQSYIDFAAGGGQLVWERDRPEPAAFVRVPSGTSVP